MVRKKRQCLLLLCFQVGNFNVPDVLSPAKGFSLKVRHLTSLLVAEGSTQIKPWKEKRGGRWYYSLLAMTSLVLPLYAELLPECTLPREFSLITIWHCVMSSKGYPTVTCCEIIMCKH